MRTPSGQSVQNQPEVVHGIEETPEHDLPPRKATYAQPDFSVRRKVIRYTSTSSPTTSEILVSPMPGQLLVKFRRKWCMKNVYGDPETGEEAGDICLQANQ